MLTFLAVLAVAMVIVLVVLAVAPCMLSSQISRREEDDSDITG